MINTVSNIWAAVGLIIMLGSLFVLAAAIFPAQSWYRRQHDRQAFDLQLQEERSAVAREGDDDDDGEEGEK